MADNTPTPEAEPQLPMWRSHKDVQAAPILQILDDPAAPAGSPVHLIVQGPDGNPLRVDAPPNFFARGRPEGQAYFVIYDDGYKSWSPREAFEAGYTSHKDLERQAEEAERAHREAEKVSPEEQARQAQAASAAV